MTAAPVHGMSEAEYANYRRRLAAVFILRVVGAIAIVYVWDALDSLQKILAIIAAAFVVPGLGTVRTLFKPYARYVSESAAEAGGERSA